MLYHPVNDLVYSTIFLFFQLNSDHLLNIAGSDKKRVIVDLSWPKVGSINSAVGENTYLGVDYMLTLPTIDHVIRTVIKFRKNPCIAKIDISRAFPLTQWILIF